MVYYKFRKRNKHIFYKLAFYTNRGTNCPPVGNQVFLEWFPRLRDTTDVQRNNWQFIGRGIGIHWEEIDEDISVKSQLSIE